MMDSYDCIVIGGGPAGSTAAGLVAAAGYSVLQVERERFPRLHVGESLMPACRSVLAHLGALEQVKAGDFVRKVCLSFISGCGARRRTFFFRDRDTTDSGSTWQVDRGRFDHLLMANAARLGADCRERVSAAEVLFSGERAVGVRLEPEAGRAQDVSARCVVDASGRQALLARQLGLVVAEERRRKAAIWGYYQGAGRDVGELAGGTLVIQSSSRNSWFWFVPVGDDVASIGVVGDREYLLGGGRAPATIFEDELVSCPGLAERMMHARLVGPLSVVKESAFQATRRAGDGWVLVGEAGGCLDPVCSSGVFLAMKSAELAAEEISLALAGEGPAPGRLGGWLESYDAGARWLMRLIDAFYRPQFDMIDFADAFPEHVPALIDLLMGRVFPDEGADPAAFQRLFDDLELSLVSRTPPDELFSQS